MHHSLWSFRTKLYFRGLEEQINNKFVFNFLSEQVFSFIKKKVEYVNLAQTKHIVFPCPFVPETISNVFPKLQVLNVSDTKIDGHSLSMLPIMIPNLKVNILDKCQHASEENIVRLMHVSKTNAVFFFKNFRFSILFDLSWYFKVHMTRKFCLALSLV